LPGFDTARLAPEAAFAALRRFCPTALAFLPGAKPTACTRRQPHICDGMTLLKLTAGPLLRGIQAVLQELAGSATEGPGLRLPTLAEGALRAWLPTHHPSCIGRCVSGFT